MEEGVDWWSLKVSLALLRKFFIVRVEVGYCESGVNVPGSNKVM
jgi:hypothetical protein